jgi:hypothetical protein
VVSIAGRDKSIISSQKDPKKVEGLMQPPVRLVLRRFPPPGGGGLKRLISKLIIHPISKSLPDVKNMGSYTTIPPHAFIRCIGTTLTAPKYILSD